MKMALEEAKSALNKAKDDMARCKGTVGLEVDDLSEHVGSSEVTLT
jgi:hypothetical protein